MANEMAKKPSHERCRSISNTVIKFARRSNSSSTNLEAPANQESEPPLPQPRSSSFFNTFSAFVPRPTAKNNNAHINKGSTTPASRPVKSPRKFSQRFSHPPPLLNSDYSCSNATEPLIPKANGDGHKTPILQRGLMRPSTNPPLPRNITMASRAPQQPGFMRSTSSSTAHSTVLPTRAPSKYRLDARSPRLSSVAKTPESLPSGSRATKTPSMSDFLEKRTSTVGTPLPSEIGKCKPNGGRYSNITHISARSPEVVLTSRMPEVHNCLTSSDPLDEEDSEEDPDGDYYEPTLETRLINHKPSVYGPPMVLPSLVPSPSLLDISCTSELTIHCYKIRTAQPTSYWLGRLTAISDRCRTETLLGPPSSNTVHDESNMHDDSRRIRYSFVHLRNLCCTREATESLDRFQRLWLENERRQEEKIMRGKEGGKRVKEKRGMFGILRGRRTGSGK